MTRRVVRLRLQHVDCDMNVMWVVHLQLLSLLLEVGTQRIHLYY